MDLFAADHPDEPSGSPARAEPGASPQPPPGRAPRAATLERDPWADPPRPSPRRWLLVAAVVPWLVLAAMLLGGNVGAEDPRPPSTEVPAAPSSAPRPVATAPLPARRDRTAPAQVEPRERVAAASVGDPGGAVRGRAVGVAIAAARAWLSAHPTPVTIGDLGTDPQADRLYVEHLAVESVDHPARGAAVVTLVALVLPVDGDAYGPARAVRLAVPLHVDGRPPRLAGAPWRLPSPDLVVEAPAVQEVDDPDLRVAATEAVADAGYEEVALARLDRTDGWPLVAHVRARAPGHDQVHTHVLWLRADVGRLVVAGTVPPGPDADDPSPSSPPAKTEETP